MPAPAAAPAEESTRDLVVHGAVLPISEPARKKWKQESLDLLAATKARGADLGTLMVLAETSARYDLDPWANEIWCASMGGQNGGSGSIAVMVGRDGYMKIAKRDDAFVACAGQAVYENDEITVEIDETGGLSKFRFAAAHPAKRGEPQGAFAILRRTDKPSLYFFAPLEQFKKGGGAWKYEDAMIVKCAQSYLLRTTYNVSGATPYDEISVGFNPDTDVDGTAVEVDSAVELPAELEGMLAVAEEVDPKSWRRNEVEARVLDGAGEPDPGAVRKVCGELAEWMQANADAVAAWSAPKVDEGDPGPEEPPVPDEPEEPAEPTETPQEGEQPPPDSEPPAEGDSDVQMGEPVEEAAEPVDAVVVEDTDEVLGLRRRAQELISRLHEAQDGTREADELGQELDAVEGRLRELGAQAPGQERLEL